MQSKELTTEEFKKISERGEEFVFYDKSPATDITEQPDTLFYGGHWAKVSGTATTSGTLYCIVAPQPFTKYKVYVYSLQQREKDKKIIVELPKTSYSYHWCAELPDFMLSNQPSWIADKIQEAKNK